MTEGSSARELPQTHVDPSEPSSIHRKHSSSRIPPIILAILISYTELLIRCSCRHFVTNLGRRSPVPVSYTAARLGP